MTTLVAANYTCFRCKRIGHHWTSDCPLSSHNYLSSYQPSYQSPYRQNENIPQSIPRYQSRNIQSINHKPATYNRSTQRRNYSSNNNRNTSNDDNNNTCIGCYDLPKYYIMIPCGHSCFCKNCQIRHQNTNNPSVCPFCRTKIEQFTKIQYKNSVHESENHEYKQSPLSYNNTATNPPYIASPNSSPTMPTENVIYDYFKLFLWIIFSILLYKYVSTKLSISLNIMIVIYTITVKMEYYIPGLMNGIQDLWIITKIKYLFLEALPFLILLGLIWPDITYLWLGLIWDFAIKHVIGTIVFVFVFIFVIGVSSS